jgi:hypothetical protein
MNQPGNNQFTITGNTFHGPAAVGISNATVVQAHGAPAPAVVAQLAEVRRLLAAHPDAVADPTQAAGDLAVVEQELARPQPDRAAVGRALARLAGRVTAGTVLIEAALTLAELVRQYLG